MTTSILLHALVFSSLLFARLYYTENTPQVMEVVYQRAVKESLPAEQVQRAIKPLKEEPFQPEPKILTPKELSSVAIKSQQAVKEPMRIAKQKKIPVHLPSLNSKRQVVVPFLSSEKITNPNYVNYQDHIRNKIKNQANHFVNDPQFQDGEVYLTFILHSDGGLKDIKIIDQKTHASAFLQSISMRSIKESSPFPPFPFELKYPELSFNVMISFVMNQDQNR